MAENNQDFAYVIRWHFEQKGFSVFFSVSGEETIALFTQNQPDIVLLDINLNDKINGKDTG
ncbi:MAG: hypothetical protein LBP72_03520 [Dysgonamonadaceae bacterium]|nr:hypothetical protein [Dysgonamonadaceae bacterium]